MTRIVSTKLFLYIETEHNSSAPPLAPHYGFSISTHVSSVFFYYNVTNVHVYINHIHIMFSVFNVEFIITATFVRSTNFQSNIFFFFRDVYWKILILFNMKIMINFILSNDFKFIKVWDRFIYINFYSISFVEGRERETMNLILWTNYISFKNSNF